MALNKSKVREAIHTYKGNISAVARAFQKSRMWIYEYCKEKHPELWLEVEQARETMLDNAESKLFENIMAGKETSLIFYLKTQGKSRGYIERSEIASPDGKELVFRVIREDGE